MARKIRTAPGMVTISTVAYVMDVSVPTVRRLCNRYLLRYTWSNNRRLFDEEELMEDMMRLHKMRMAGQIR